jgi:hypothetical protein
MFKKFVYFSCLIIVLNLSSTSMASLVAHWSLDEGSGNTVEDSVGGNNGTLLNGPTWISGVLGGALSFDGINDCIEIGNNPAFNSPPGSFCVALWVNIRYWGTQWSLCPIGIRGDGAGWSLRRFGNWWSMQYPDTYTMPYEVLSFTTRGVGHAGDGVEDSPSWTVPPQNEWLHITCIYDHEKNKKYIYFNGVVDAEWDTNPGTVTPATQKLYIGAMSNAGDTGPENFFNGLIDDVRFYDSALSAGEVMAVYRGSEKGAAVEPQPGNGSTEISIDVGEISWTPGEFVEAQNGTHNVFFGTDEDSVTKATLANPLGVTVYPGLAFDANSITLGSLDYGTTYYWRVDEVNNPASTGTIKGDVWSFKTELEGYPIAPEDIVNVTAVGGAYPDVQEPNSTANELGLDANDMHSTDLAGMWLGMGNGPGEVWIQYEFDKIYKLHDMLVWNYNEESPGDMFGAKDVNIAYSQDGDTWTALEGPIQLNQATGNGTYTANTTVEFNGAIAKYIKITFLTSWSDMDIYGLSEVRFSAIPTRAQQPDPADGASDIDVQPVLSWKAGRDAAAHNLNLSTDVNSVTDASVAPMSLDEASYVPTLDLAKTYYWRVDEVNNAEAYPVWDGPVWSLSTVDYLVIDGFEAGYGDTDANAVWATWVDGYGTTTNGSQMGNESAPYLSTSNHSSGNGHSAPMQYDNTSATYSEVTAQVADLPIGMTDWTIGSPTALVIWFRGEPNNTPAQMYVKLNDSKVLYDGDPVYLTQSVWRSFVVDLSKFNVNIGNITSITIGIEKAGSQAGKGMVLLDDISLYAVGPEIAEAVDPGNNGLIAYYSMENDVQDKSGNGHNGTIIGTPTYVQGPIDRGMALQFHATTFDCVDLGNNAAFNPTGSFSVSLWANITSWTTSWGCVMVGNRGENGVGWQLRRYSNNNFCFTTRGIENDDTNSNGNPPLNEWINITCVYDSVAHAKTIYFDGVLNKTVSTSATNTVIAATTHNTYIGARANNGNTGQEGFFTGMLDEIRIYNRALSAGEAAYLANPTP